MAQLHSTILYTVAWNLKTKGIGALVVVSEDGDHILGIISERDIVRALIEHGGQILALPVSKAMTSPVLTCARKDRVAAVMAHMTRHRMRHLPVVEGGKLAGLTVSGTWSNTDSMSSSWRPTSCAKP